MDHAELVAAVIDGIENLDYDSLASLVTDDFYFEREDGTQTDFDSWFGALQVWKQAFPDITYNLVYEGSDGNIATVSSQLTGTHNGPLDLSMMGGPTVPATGIYVEANPQYSESEIVGDRASYIRLIPAEGGGIAGLLAGVGVDMG